jgi:hypothetical protein
MGVETGVMVARWKLKLVWKIYENTMRNMPLGKDMTSQATSAFVFEATFILGPIRKWTLFTIGMNRVDLY